jgi:Cyclin
MQVVDYYNFDRITVTMAMCYIDRVLWRKVSRLLLVEGIVRTNTTDTTSRTESRRNHQQDKNKSFLQLLAVASLYLAIKLFEKHYPIHNMLVDLVLMSKGKFSADEIIGMESYILKELEWNVVHVPVPQHFLHHLLKLAYVSFPAMNKSSANKIMNHANYFIEVVAFDNSFAQESASVIASAALLISIQQLLANDTYASDAIRATLEHTIMTRKPLPYSFCGGIMMSRMEIIQHVMERIDNFVTKHLHHGKEH